MPKHFDEEDYEWSDPAAALGRAAKGFSSTTPSSSGIYKTGSSHAVTGERCYQSHPPLPLGNGLVVYGGSCWSPAVKDADIYVGLDSGMTATPRAFPWNPGHEIKFPITDGCAPKDAGEFKKLVSWLFDQITIGAKVHIGCIGGHGRTGLLLSALVATATGEKDAITYVRANYCKKAVETQEQVAFLGKHYAILSAAGSKAGYTGESYVPALPKKLKTKFSAPAVQSAGCMWGKKAVNK